MWLVSADNKLNQRMNHEPTTPVATMHPSLLLRIAFSIERREIYSHVTQQRAKSTLAEHRFYFKNININTIYIFATKNILFLLLKRTTFHVHTHT